MFADGTVTGLCSTGSCAASEIGASTTRELPSGMVDEQSLSNVEGVHLVPCHIHFSGASRVSEHFKPTRVSDPSGDYEVLLHGRYLRGREISLSESVDGFHIRGYAAISGDTTASPEDIRNEFVGNTKANCDDVCVDNEGKDSKVPTLQTLGNFEKFVYWQQGKTPSVDNDVTQSILFLKAAVSLHDFSDEVEAS